MHLTQPSRRSFLKLMGGAGLTAAVLPAALRSRSAGPRPKNIVLFLTDQDRAVGWYPEGWAEANLPCLTALRRNGLEFKNAFTNTCQCTPARATLFTGVYPAQHGSKDVLTENFTQSFAQIQLDANLPNLATTLRSAGYDVVYKGKWHLTKPGRRADGTPVYDDISRYGFDGWDSPDAGDVLDSYGGGTQNNDGRFVDDAISFLEDRIRKPSERPFCLIVSLVNPHDVLAYPARYANTGFDQTMLQGSLTTPTTMGENLAGNRKPTIHRQLQGALPSLLGPLSTPEQQTKYVNFYANLVREVDQELYRILQFLDATRAGRALRNDSMIIRLADHGEMTLAHGGLRQKTYVAYEECVNIPTIWSNPEMFPEPVVSDSLVSHVDLVPTVASFCGVSNWQSLGFKGVDYSAILENPGLDVQNEIVFTYDDVSAGLQDFGNGFLDGANRIQMIRTKEFKYARYWDATYNHKEEEEFYNLATDVDPSTGAPLEMLNVSAWADRKGIVPRSTPLERLQRAELKAKLESLATTTLAPRSPSTQLLPMNESVGPFHWVDAQGQNQSAIEVRFVSQSVCLYQIQVLVEKVWEDAGTQIRGHNGPILVSFPFQDPMPSYRVVRTLAA